MITEGLPDNIKGLSEQDYRSLTDLPSLLLDIREKCDYYGFPYTEIMAGVCGKLIFEWLDVINHDKYVEAGQLLIKYHSGRYSIDQFREVRDAIFELEFLCLTDRKFIFNTAVIFVKDMSDYAVIAALSFHPEKFMQAILEINPEREEWFLCSVIRILVPFHSIISNPKTN